MDAHQACQVLNPSAASLEAERVDGSIIVREAGLQRAVSGFG